jgi:hypothetical protein
MRDLTQTMHVNAARPSAIMLRQDWSGANFLGGLLLGGSGRVGGLKNESPPPPCLVSMGSTG